MDISCNRLAPLEPCLSIGYRSEERAVSCSRIRNSLFLPAPALLQTYANAIQSVTDVEWGLNGYYLVQGPPRSMPVWDNFPATARSALG